MKRTTFGLFGTVVVLGQLLAPSTGSAQPLDLNLVKTEQTLAAMSDIGASIFAWITYNIPEEPPPGITPQRIGKVDPVDWSQCPRISHSELTKLLVPNYIREVPERDGWGNHFQFCLNRANLFTGTYLVGIRSSGRDGQFDDKPLRRGSFDPQDYDHDIVWLDAFLVAWPLESQP